MKHAAMEPAGILRRDAARDLGLAAALVLLGALAIGAFFGFGFDYTARALLLYGGGACVIGRTLPATLPYQRFGAANRVTLLRFAASVLLAAVFGEAAPVPDLLAWAVVALATVAALMDVLDGRLARRHGIASAFGARFDLETDAWLTLVLSALVLHFDKAGAWVLAAGLMRYAFVVAARPWPWLASPLPASLRRQTICVVQITTLIVCLAPVIPRAAAAALAAASLAGLAWSFAVDVAALARGRRQTLEHSS